jgi:hypothetical protein
MKKIIKVVLALNVLLIFMLAFPTGVSAAPLADGRTVFGDDYTLESGRILEGDLTVIGGMADIENNATVRGDVFVVGGVIKVDGTIEGTLSAIGSTVTLNENALIEGDLNVPGSQVTRDASAIVEGDQITSWSTPFGNFDRPWVNNPRIVSRDRVILPIINRIGRAIGMTLLVMALGALLLLIMPKSTERMTQTLVAKPWEVLGFGVLTGFAFLVLVVILTITICLIPIAALLGLALGLALLVGWLTLGYELGKQIVGGIFKSHWTAVPTAVLGNFVLYVMSRAIRLIPCLGGFLVLLVALFGLGMVVVTFFGTKSYPRIEEVDENQPIILNAENNKADDQKVQEDLPEEKNES